MSRLSPRGLVVKHAIADEQAMRLAAVTVVVVLGTLGTGFALHAHNGRIREQNRLAPIASSIAGRRVGVHCPSLLKKLTHVGGELGSVQFDRAGRPADHTDLAPDTCKALARYHGSRWNGDVAQAVHTLAHESYHLRGIRDEATADCYALQTDAYVAERLGARADDARALARWYLVRAYPYKPDEYHSAECRNGGTLDLRPANPEWP
jgi:hypothetical protein